MTLSSAMSAALSGLTAASRGAGTVSSNVANSLTEGYGRRELELAVRALGPGASGVRVVTERRVVDAGLAAERWLAEAAAGAARTRSDALAELEAAFGVPGEPGALATRIAALEGALTEALSRPDQLVRLETVLAAAGALAGTLAALGHGAQDGRAAAERGIAEGVARLNGGLGQLAEINRTILREIAAGRVPNGLYDHRQTVIDGLAELVPLRVMERPMGQIALYTDTGAMLLDGTNAARIGFETVTGPIVPEMTRANGALAGLTLNGAPVGTGPTGALGGGALGSLFALRDALLPEVQAGLDALAADLVTRFAAADADGPAPLGAGLIVDAGGGGPEGLAQRLSLNPAADPAAGGEVWRLRAGLGAAVPGAPGDGRALAGLLDALAAPRPLGAPGFSGLARDVSGHAAELQSRHGRARDLAEAELGFAAGRSASLGDALAADGVDTDAEMQRLLVIERAYAANARVLKTADEMLQTLLAI